MHTPNDVYEEHGKGSLLDPPRVHLTVFHLKHLVDIFIRSQVLMYLNAKTNTAGSKNTITLKCCWS